MSFADYAAMYGDKKARKGENYLGQASSEWQRKRVGFREDLNPTYKAAPSRLPSPE